MSNIISFGAGEVGIGNGVTFLEYIQTTGTQFIDTKWKPTNHNIEVKIKCSPSSAGTNAWGFASIAGDTQWCNPCGYSSGYEAFFIGTSGSLGAGAIDYSQVYEYDLYCSGTTSAVSSSWVKRNVTQLYSSTVGGAFTNTGNNGTFCIGTTGSTNNYVKTRCSSGKYYYCKLYQDGTLVHDLYPARRDDGEIGMYDAITYQFFMNCGTGTFVEGPEVSAPSGVSTLIPVASNRFDCQPNPKFYPRVISGTENLISGLSTSYNGYISYAYEYRIGNIVTLYLSWATSTATTIPTGVNILTATYNGSRPPYDIETHAYYGHIGIGLRIEPSGALTIRHVSKPSMYFSGGGGQFSITYIVD